MSETTDPYQTHQPVGATAEIRLRQLRELSRSPGYAQFTWPLAQRLNECIFSLVSFNIVKAEDVQTIIALQVEARVLASLIGGFGQESLLSELLKETAEQAVEDAKKAAGVVDNSDTEDEELHRSPSPLL